MSGDVIGFDIETSDKLLVEGVNYKGFGILPKYVMLDPDLTIEAKTIYAYFCSFSGNGNTSFPGRDKILSELPMSKDAYYKHFKLLTEQGYITARQETGERATFSRNIYTLVSNPKKFSDKPSDTKHGLAYSRIRFSGLKSAGFGMIPKAVMTEPNLQVKAKGIYAYFCSFTGSGNNAFPKHDKILYHLGITKNTYYKFLNILLDLNFIYVVQRRIDGKMSVNDYYLEDNPNIAKNANKGILVISNPFPKIQDTEDSENLPFPKIQDTEDSGNLPFPKIQDTEEQENRMVEPFSPLPKLPYPKLPLPKNQDTNINNLNINNLNINNPSINQEKAASLQPAKPEPEELMDRLSEAELMDIVFDELYRDKSIPFWYKNDYRRITAAIHIMTEWKIRYPDGYGGNDVFMQSVYNLFNDALIGMCCSDSLMQLNGSNVNYSHVIEKINQLAEYKNTYIDISVFMDTAISNFASAASERTIRNPLQYMKSCIWTAMQTGYIGIYSSLKRDGYMRN